MLAALFLVGCGDSSVETQNVEPTQVVNEVSNAVVAESSAPEAVVPESEVVKNENEPVVPESEVVNNENEPAVPESEVVKNENEPVTSKE
ncbi:hypothetical protein KKG72_06955 [bacterium]|nr:hypothetical protein [bacterium]